jgi:DNA-binding transcriptional LysR family regulator
LQAVAASQHPLVQQGTVLTADDLAQHTQVVIRDSGRERPRDEGWLGAQHRWTVSSVEASLAAVTAGLAYAWLPAHVIESALREGKLVPLRLDAGTARKLSLSVVLVKPQSAGPAARAALELFQRHAARRATA